MQLRGLLLIAALIAPTLSGCFGPPPVAAAALPKYAPYTHFAPTRLDGMENREPACPEGECTEYYLVRVIGSENATRLEGPDVLQTCSKPWLFDLNAGNHSVTYNASKNQGLKVETLNTLVVQEFWGITFSQSGAIGLNGCPTTYGLRGHEKNPPPHQRMFLGSYEWAEATVYRDGYLWFTGAAATKGIGIEIGQALLVSYGRFHYVGNTTYFVQGGFEVSNLGPWPLSELRPGAGSIRPQG